jgi:hypothetical protein
VVPETVRDKTEANSEVEQANYIVKTVRLTETKHDCAGIVISAFTDWEGALPSISSPARGHSILYTNGICDTTGKPRLAYHVLREYWASGREQPLAMTAASREENALILLVGLALVILLFTAVRRNNLLRFNLGRTFTSPRGFFQDISERRYTQTGQTVLLAMMISGGLSMLIAGWLFTNRRNYALDWLLGFLFGDTEILRWMADLVWHPSRALAFFWGLSFILAWLAAIRLAVLCKMLGRSCSVNQSLTFFSWSSVAYLVLLPVGMLSQRLFEGSVLWLVLSVLIILSLWSHQRLMSVIAQHVRKSELLVTILWFVGPAILFVLVFTVLEYSYQITDYWEFFWGTIA